MMQSHPARRPGADLSLSHPWFEPLHGMTVPVHHIDAPSHQDPASTSSGLATSSSTLGHTTVPEPSAVGLAGCAAYSDMNAHASQTLCDPYAREAAVRSVEAPEVGVASY